MDILTDIFKANMLEDEHLLKLFKSSSELCSFDANQAIFCSSDNIDDVFILVSGIVRMYTISRRGTEITDAFLWKPGDVVLGLKEYFEDNEGFSILEYCEACTQCSMIKIPRRIIRDSLDLYPKLRNTVIMAHINRWRNLLHLRHTMMFADASGRYDWFLKSHPGLIDLVPHKDIASFLGMNPVTLSRIRRSRTEPLVHKCQAQPETIK